MILASRATLNAREITDGAQLRALPKAAETLLIDNIKESTEYRIPPRGLPGDELPPKREAPAGRR